MGFWGHKIHHRLVCAHPEMGSWNVIIHYLMDNVTNEDQSLQIHFQVYTYFGCWVPITARAAWQEERKVRLKNIADFLPVSFEMEDWTSRIFFLLIKEFVSWRQSEKWHLGSMCANRLQCKEASCKYCISNTGKTWQLQDFSAINLGESRTVDVRKMYLKARKQRSVFLFSLGRSAE